MSKLIVKEKKGYTYRLLDVETNITYRVFQRDFKEVDLIVGTLFECEYEAGGSLIEEMNISKEIIGDSSKQRVEVNVEEVKVGDLIDGIPVLNLGRTFAKKGKKVAYAYFK